MSTPIGNLGDLTHRARDVLAAADLVLAEDTRRTGLLLRHLEISARMLSTHAHNEQARTARVLEMLRGGARVALVSDAGTPLLSDPGARIVHDVVAAGFPVVPVPGASALLAALVASGIAAERFVFYGFLARKGPERAAALEEIGASRYTAVLYESPHRTVALLDDLIASADAERQVAVARELTKLHEEFVRGTLADVAEALRARGGLLGEIVVVLAGRTTDAAQEAATDAMAGRALADALIAQGLSPSAAARELRSRLGIARNDAYSLAQDAAARLE